ATVPSVQTGAVAIPAASVATVPLAPSEPPPDSTANVTLTPATGLSLASLTRTLGAIATALPTTADWPLPPLIVIVVAVPAPTVIVPDCAGLRPVAANASVLSPVAPTIDRSVNVAVPAASVGTATTPSSAPPPVAI